MQFAEQITQNWVQISLNKMHFIPKFHIRDESQSELMTVYSNCWIITSNITSKHLH